MIPQSTQPGMSQSRALLLSRLMNYDYGAAIVLINLLQRGRTLGEPVSKEVEWCLAMLDKLDICGDNLDVFWCDVCHHSADEMFSLLRSCYSGCDGVSCDTIWRDIACYKQEAASLGRRQLVSEVPGL